MLPACGNASRLLVRTRKGIFSFWMPRARIVFRRLRRRSGSIPAEEQTALKSFLSSKRNSSALRLKRSGPHIHSSSVLVITARQSLSSAVPLSAMCNSELLNMEYAPRKVFVVAERDAKCSWGTRTPGDSWGKWGVTEILGGYPLEHSQYSVCLRPES